MPSLTEYAMLLLAHDWHYDRADDRHAYRQGHEERVWLTSIARQTDDHAALYRRAYYMHR